MANLSQGFSEIQNKEYLLQVVSYKIEAEVHALLMSNFDHNLNRRFLCMWNNRVPRCIGHW